MSRLVELVCHVCSHVLWSHNCWVCKFWSQSGISRHCQLFCLYFPPPPMVQTRVVERHECAQFEWRQTCEHLLRCPCVEELSAAPSQRQSLGRDTSPYSNLERERFASSLIILSQISWIRCFTAILQVTAYCRAVTMHANALARLPKCLVSTAIRDKSTLIVSADWLSLNRTKFMV